MDKLKACRKCNKIKPISDFYKHPQMADGHLNICKECVKRRSQNNKTVKRICRGCGEEFLANANEIKRRSGGGTFCSKKCWLTHQRERLEEIWDERGRKSTTVYGRAHKFIRRNFGKADHCEACGASGDDKPIYHWANLSGEYKLDRADWMQMCPSCHKAFDNNQFRTTGVRAMKHLSDIVDGMS